MYTNIKFSIREHIHNGHNSYTRSGTMLLQLTDLTNSALRLTDIPQCTILTEMCTAVHIYVKKWCIVGYRTGAL